MKYTIRAVIGGMILAFVGFHAYGLIQDERARRAQRAAAVHVPVSSVVVETSHGQVVLAVLDTPDGMRCVISIPGGNPFCYQPAQRN
jgi:hypothetical protein